MTLPFIAAVTAMLIVALFVILLPLLRGNSGTLRRLRESRAELRALEEARATGGLEASDYASRRAALGESLLSILDTEPKRTRAILYIGPAVVVLVPLAALGAYRWLGSPQAVGETASLSGETAMPMPDHGADMQAAIATLAEKLRQHPDDAEGWALLGRTYKATEHYAEARDAFHHALELRQRDASKRRSADSVRLDGDCSGGAGAVDHQRKGRLKPPLRLPAHRPMRNRHTAANPGIVIGSLAAFVATGWEL